MADGGCARVNQGIGNQQIKGEKIESQRLALGTHKRARRLLCPAASAPSVTAWGPLLIHTVPASGETRAWSRDRKGSRVVLFLCPPHPPEGQWWGDSFPLWILALGPSVGQLTIQRHTSGPWTQLHQNQPKRLIFKNLHSLC